METNIPMDRATAAVIIADAPNIRVENAWEFTSESYPLPARQFAQSFGRLIQMNLMNGIEFAKAAELAKTVALAYYEFVDGAANIFYFNALRILEKAGWCHSKELRKWHTEVYGV